MEREKFYGGEVLPDPRGLATHDVEWLVDDLVGKAMCLDVSRHTPGYVEGYRDALREAVRVVNRLEMKRWLADGSPRKGGD